MDEVLIAGKAAARDRPGTMVPCGVGCWLLIVLERFRKENGEAQGFKLRQSRPENQLLALSDSLSCSLGANRAKGQTSL